MTIKAPSTTPSVKAILYTGIQISAHTKSSEEVKIPIHKGSIASQKVLSTGQPNMFNPCKTSSLHCFLLNTHISTHLVALKQEQLKGLERCTNVPNMMPYFDKG